MTQRRETRRINLALQGGGAHGAFTWGVLERLLDEDWLEIDAISGTSAGALNGAALKAGLSRGGGAPGRRAARENLEWLWTRIGEVPSLRNDQWAETVLPWLPPPARRWAEVASPFGWLGMMMRMVSPYDFGPLWQNPLRTVVEGLPFADICRDCAPRFFVSATNVRTGKIRVFSGAEIGADAILASACLPTVFQAVEIDDPATGRREAYWDGGYSGNPALFPLFAADLPRDIVVVGINPLLREAVPRTPGEIEDRINEISFNASLLREMRAIHFVKRLIAGGQVAEGAMKDVLMHMIADDGLMVSLGVETKLLPDRHLLARLRSAGQAAADDWLEAHADSIGNAPSIDLMAMFG